MTEEEQIEESLKAVAELKDFMSSEGMFQAMDSSVLHDIDDIIKEEKSVTPVKMEPTDEDVYKMTDFVKTKDLTKEIEEVKEVVKEPKKETETDPEPEPEPETESVQDDFDMASMEEAIIEKAKKETKPSPKVKKVELEEPEEEYNRKKELIHAGISLLICVAIALAISFLITNFVAHHTEVEGSSMESTLQDGDQIIVENVSYYLHDPERFDIIVFPFSDGVYYIKRIIALPGETIQIVDGKIYIDGSELIENYGTEAISDPGLAASEITLAKDEYFVLGDNRNSSIDSRKAEVGVVKRNEIEGKAWLRFYPFSSFSFLTGTAVETK